MSQFVRICPKCQTQNPEYEHVCTACGQFIAMESPVAIPKAEENQNTALEAGSKQIIPTKQIPETEPTQRLAVNPTTLSIYLELQSDDKPIFTVKSGWFMGQAHSSNQAEIQIDAHIKGSECVHRRHCRFVYKDQHWYVQALNQKRYQGEFTNPTKVNDKIIVADKARQIKNGDILRLSGLSFQVKLIA